MYEFDKLNCGPVCIIIIYKFLLVARLLLMFFSIILEEIFKAGNIERKLLPSDFYDLPPIEQVK